MREPIVEPAKIFWTKSYVFPLQFPNIDGPKDQVVEMSVTHYPEIGKGLFINSLETTACDDTSTFSSKVYIRKEVIPDVIAALQSFLSRNQE